MKKNTLELLDLSAIDKLKEEIRVEDENYRVDFEKALAAASFPWRRSPR
jgi:hypothetical protein